MKTKLLLACVAVLAFTSVVAAEKKIKARSFLDQKAPKFEAEKWITAAPDCKDKFVLVDFWATWCGPCKRSIPKLNALQKKFNGQLIVIGLTQDPEAKVRAMVDPRIEYFSAVDTQGRTMKAVEVTAIPHAILMDPKGIVRWQGNPTGGVVEKEISDILAKAAK